MQFGLRAILLIVAIVLFVVAIFTEGNQGDLLAIGLAAFAAAFLVEDLNIGPRGRRRVL